MNLSPHFTLAEMTVSEVAARRGISNEPTPEALEALYRTAKGLEAVRAVLGKPIIVTSGYRSPAVNRLVGGQPSSQHLRGEAADFICPGFGTPADVVAALVKSAVQYDQCILEFGRWVHISFAPAFRRMALIIDANGTRPYA
jgi:zinc D-Ala-D-Ala carboxypeptidase